METGILYAAVAYVCSVSTLMVWFRVRALSGNAKMRKPFLRLLTFFVLFTLIDGTWGLFFSKLLFNNWLLFSILTYAFHVGAAVSAFWWAGFICSFLEASEQTRRAIDTVRMMLFSVQVILLAANIKTQFAFYITPELEYVALKPRHIMFQLQFCYYVFIMGFVAVLLTQVKDLPRRGKYSAAIFFSFIPLLFGIGQMKYPDAPFYSLGFMVTSVAIYLTTVTREREQVDLQRQEEANRLSHIVNALSTDYEAIYYVDLDTNNYQNVVYESDYNNHVAPMLARCGDFFKDVIHNVSEVIYPDDKDMLLSLLTKENILRTAETGKPISVIYRIIVDGKLLYYHLKVVYFREESGAKKAIIGVSNVDDQMIERQQRELAITSLSDDYDSIYSCNLNKDTLENISTTSTQEEIRYLANETRYSVFVKKIMEYVHPDDRTAMLIELAPENISFKLAAQKAFYISYRQLINNVVRYYRMKILRTDNWETDTEFMLGTNNVDDLIRRQISLTEDNTRKTSVLNALAESYESVCYIDTTEMSYIPYFGSPELLKWYKSNYFRADFIPYVQQEVVEEDREALLEAISDEKISELLAKADTDKEAFMPVQFRTEAGGIQKYHELTFSKIDGSHIIAAIQDRDTIIRNEEEQKKVLAEAKEKAEAASKAKTTFLFNMSHDIRTPMNAVHGFIELAERNLDDRNKIAGYLAKAKTSGEHLLKLINDILDMSRIESGKVTIDPVPTDIRAETEKLFAILDVSAREKGVELTTDISSIRNNFVYSDILHIDQILLNIVSNGIKYTKPGGTVSLTIKQLEDTKEGEASYCIMVRDTGVGMSHEFQDHIFEEFSRAKNTTQSGIEGTGLGMAIVKRLVDMMGGAIEIASELGKGTVVQVYLTFKTAESETTDTGKAEIQETSLSGKKLLLVEDNELNREIAHDILAYEGLDIEEAEDGSIAVEKVRMHKPDYYDFVLMDVQMPYMDGYQATRAIRSLTNDDYTKLPIIAMTANAFEDDIKNAYTAGMNGHLSKPINVPELVQCLKKNLHRM